MANNKSVLSAAHVWRVFRQCIAKRAERVAIRSCAPLQRKPGRSTGQFIREGRLGMALRHPTSPIYDVISQGNNSLLRDGVRRRLEPKDFVKIPKKLAPMQGPADDRDGRG